MFKTALRATAITAFVLVSAFGAQAKNPMVGGAPMYTTKNIVQNAMKSKDHTTLVAAVKAAGLVKTLEGKGPFTVFAPTNEAFAALPAGTVDTLLKPENKEKLTAILTGHVVAGKVLSTDLKDGQAAKTVGGNEVKVKIDGGKVSVSGANVTKADIAASNGVIHVIDTVIVP